LRIKKDIRRSKFIKCEISCYEFDCLWGLKLIYWGLKMILVDLNLSNVKSMGMNSSVCEGDNWWIED
jgi:hypothetical protein